MNLPDMIDPAKDTVRIVPGYANQGSNISVGGLVQPAVWVTSAVAEPGDPLIVAMVDRQTAQSQAVVLGVTGKYAAPAVQPREGTVATAPSGSETITVSTAAGEVTATFLASYVPAVSDRVRLYWDDGGATVLGKVGVTPTPPPPAPKPVVQAKVTPPPPKPPTGTADYAAASSGTFTASYGVWNTYYKSDLYQGSYGGATGNTGVWFYHGKPGALKGKTITRARIYIPARQRAGNYNQSVTLNLRLHTSSRKPGGNVTLTGTTHEISIPKGWGGGWKDLPVAWGADILKGYGVAISGGDYAGLNGIQRTRSSGQLKLDWRG